MINELRNKSNEELGQLVVKMKSKLLEYRFQEASGELEGTHKMKMVKKTIAYALTVLSERNVKLSLSSHDHALVTVQSGKLITKSFKPKGSSSIVFDNEETNLKKTKTKKSKKEKNETPIIATSEKKPIEKKLTKSSKKKQKSSGVPSSVIRKSTGRGQ